MSTQGSHNVGSSSRYCVGIDLGTTNTVVSFVDTLTADSGGEVSQLFPIDQLVAPDTTQRLLSLPSVLLYDPHATHGWWVGRYAREQIRYAPERIIASSKSWLAHAAVDRENRILPWGSREVPADAQLSPVQAATEIVRCVRDSWNREMGGRDGSYLLEAQHVVVTVPASFDEVAQRLTLQAVRALGLTNVRLLEEPQCAFYRWLEAASGDIRKHIGATTQTVLVCDVGGGTTDLSLFDVRWEEERIPIIKRIEVSDHLLLGGDNIDAALAEFLAEQLAERQGREVSTTQRMVLRSLARDMKEQALSDTLPESGMLSVSIPGSGSSLFSDAVSLQLSVDEIQSRVIDSFFPVCTSRDRPEERKVGLREIGLPYARDPRVTHHLAAFLEGYTVDAVLFNGGTLASSLIRERICGCIAGWQGTPVRELATTELDTAVARGAAWYGYMQRVQQKSLILSGYPRSLYLELFRERRSDPARFLCVVPQGFASFVPLEIRVPGLAAVVEKPVRFQLWSSRARPRDKAGDILSGVISDLTPVTQVVTKLELPPRHAMSGQSSLGITLASTISETGLCELECRGEVPLLPQSGASEGVAALQPVVWRFELSARPGLAGALGEGEEGEGSAPLAVSPALVQQSTEVIDRLFGRRRSEDEGANPRSLFKDLERAVRAPRDEWGLGYMRALWPAFERGITRRNRSLEHEVAWFNGAGFILRPGFGDILDTVRIDEAWRVQQLGLAHPKEQASKAAACIFFRRIAAGLSRERQELLFERYYPELGKLPPHLAEIVRLLASLERISDEAKSRVVDAVFVGISSGRAVQQSQAWSWSLERLFSRISICGELDAVVAGSVIEGWIERLLDLKQSILSKEELQRILLSAGARADDERRDISPRIREMIRVKLTQLATSAAMMKPLHEVVPSEPRAIARLLGDTVPAGVRVIESSP
jgi:molecular chaperone DnaK (HSP70)